MAQIDKPIAAFWYGVRAESDGILRINEIHVDPYSVGDMWLVRGAARAVLVDTGSGIVPPAPLIETVSGKPVLAVALNCYYDHAGGWPGFAERACHALDAAALKSPDAENAVVSKYMTDDSLSALPHAGYTTADYSMTGAEPTQLIKDGEIIDLGDRELEVLHLPGRTPGGIALWEAATGSLFTSDMLYDGEQGPAWPPDDPSAYINSLHRLRALPVKHVYPGHYGPFGAARMTALIDEQVADLGG